MKLARTCSCSASAGVRKEIDVPNEIRGAIASGAANGRRTRARGPDQSLSKAVWMKMDVNYMTVMPLTQKNDRHTKSNIQRPLIGQHGVQLSGTKRPKRIIYRRETNTCRLGFRVEGFGPEGHYQSSVCRGKMAPGPVPQVQQFARPAVADV